MSVYVVKPGDNLSSIAAKYGVDYHKITGYKSGNASLIYPGEQLTIPDGKGTGSQVTPAAAETTVDPAQDWAKSFADAQKEVAQEQINYTKDFINSNPFSFDENLARQSSEERFRPYYTQLLNDFTQDITVRNRRSTEEEKALLDELTNNTQYQLKSNELSYQKARSQAQEGFAGQGLGFSGVADQALGQNEVGYNLEQQHLQDQSNFQNQAIQRAGMQEREQDLLPGELTSLQRKQRDIFGPEFGYDTPGQFQDMVNQDIGSQKSTELQNWKYRVTNAIGDKYGYVNDNVNNFLAGIYG